MKRFAIFFLTILMLVLLVSCDEDVCQHRDADDNSLCDKCGEAYTDGIDVTPENTPSVCQHRDADDNALCDKCGEAYTDGIDVTPENTPSVCQHRDADDNALCDKCGTSYADVTDEGVVYRIPEGANYAEVVDYRGVSQNVIIADVYEGVPVTRIAAHAFDYTNIRSIDIPASITSIGDKAFFYCTRLMAVNFEENSCLTTIGDAAFGWCSALNEITIPASVTDMGYAFDECALVHITNLSKLTLNVEDDMDVHPCCEIRTSLDTPFVNTLYTDDDGCVIYTVEETVELIGCVGDSVMLDLTGKGITIIRNFALIGRRMAHLVIPDGVTEISGPNPNGSKIVQITNLSELNVDHWAVHPDCEVRTSFETPFSGTVSTDDKGYVTYTIGEKTYLLDYVGGNTVLDLRGTGITDIWPLALAFRQDIQSVILSPTMTDIDEYVFAYCSGLESVTIPSSVTSLGSYAFSFCTNLKAVEFESNSRLTHIGELAFENCNSLADIILPSGVLNIGYNAFTHCTSLTSFTIPESVIVMAENVFYGCTAITEFYFNATAMEDSDRDFSLFYNVGNEQGITVTIGANVTRIPNSMFHKGNYGDSNSNIIAVVFEAGSVCKSIGDFAFYGCEGLASIIIPVSITSIGDWAFEDCGALEAVFYDGTANQWSSVSIDWHNSCLSSATHYYYSDEAPTTTGNYWHYDENGKIAIW